MAIVNSMEEFDKAWPMIEPSLDPKFEIRRLVHTRDDVLAKIATGQVIVFYSDRAAILVELLPDGLPTLNLWASGGDLRDLRNILFGEVEEWGRANGYRQLRGEGRKAWGATAIKQGWKPAAVIYTKEL